MAPWGLPLPSGPGAGPCCGRHGSAAGPTPGSRPPRHTRTDGPHADLALWALRLGAGRPLSLIELRRREDLRDAILRRRAGRPRRQKLLSVAARDMLAEAGRLLRPGGGALPAAIAEALVHGRAPLTWNRYAGPVRAWAGFATSRRASWLPADPELFAEFLASRASSGAAAVKAACCAIRAVSELAGVPAPGEHPLVAAVRRGSRRLSGVRRGGARPIFSGEIPVAPQDGAGVPAPRAGARPLSDRSRRAREAAADHMSVLQAGAFRYDDLAEGQLGDVLHYPEWLDMSVFGSKTDPASTGQAAIIPVDPGPSSGSSALVRRAAAGLQRLLDLETSTLRTMGAKLSAALGPSDRAGPEALATWPHPIPAMAARLYAVGLQAHRGTRCRYSGAGSLTSCPPIRTCLRSRPRANSSA